MKDAIRLKKDYRAACHEICVATKWAARDLANTLDFLTEQVGNEPQGLRPFLKEYLTWFGSRFDEIGFVCQEDQSLATQQHFEGLHDRLVELFEQAVPEIEKAAKANLNEYTYLSEEDVLRDVQNTRNEIALARQQITAFKEKYALEVAADIASDGYQQERGAVHAAIIGVQRAALGQWTPELSKSGFEMPGSEAIRDIVEMPQTRELVRVLFSPKP